MADSIHEPENFVPTERVNHDDGTESLVTARYSGPVPIRSIVTHKVTRSKVCLRRGH
jgi:hypothetical protein